MSNGSSNPGTSSRPTTSGTNPAQMSRAERFEDEKRRIIDSCFSKHDQNGQLSESYITHIRIQEDSAHPSAPAPPDSAPSNKKARVIVIAVRSTGRVRMHKARENNNGSYSIGKTWNLEELSAIESYANATDGPKTEKEAQMRQYAGSVGFTVTITKPYHWQAGTAKEKEFFIASTVKIYRKYTKGQVPELKGFDETQKAAVLGSALGQPQRPPGPAAREPSNEAPAPPQPPFAQRPQSRDNSRYRQSPGPPSSVSDREHSVGGASGHRVPSESPGPRSQQHPAVPKPFASREQLRSPSRDAVNQDPRVGSAPGPGGFPRSPPPPHTRKQVPSAQSSRQQLRAESPRDPSVSSPAREELPRVQPQASQSSFANRRQQQREDPPEDRYGERPSSNGRAASASSQTMRDRRINDRQPRSQSPAPQLPALQVSSNDQGRPPRTPVDQRPPIDENGTPSFDSRDAPPVSPNSFSGPRRKAAPTPPAINDAASPPTPERSKRRPTLPEPTESTQDLKPPPLSQRGRPAPIDGTSNYATSMEGSAEPTPMTEDGPEVKPLSPAKNRAGAPLPGAFQPPDSVTTPPTGDERGEPETPDLGEEHRPGLGPMIKKQAMADRIKKAAQAANSFKPRPGGAAEKILRAKAEREGGVVAEPDGITGVVPRPKLQQEQTREVAAVEQPEEAVGFEAPSQEPPKVEVSSPPTPPRRDHYQAGDSMDGASGRQVEENVPRLQTPDDTTSKGEEEDRKDATLEERQRSQSPAKQRRRNPLHEQYLAELGIDSSLIPDETIDIANMLHDFGWNDENLSSQAISKMEMDIRREQAQLEAGSWLSLAQENTLDTREKQVHDLLERTIQECDEMDGRLTLYSVELDTLSSDINYIEAQSQGLQVQAANQRLLHTELGNMLDTISLDKRALEPLRQADLSNFGSIEDTEQCLVKLYQAMVTIDPSIRSASSGRPKSRSGLNEGNELSSMAALRQKREVYERESGMFSQRLMQHLDYTCTTSFDSAKSRVMQPALGGAGAVKLNSEAFTGIRKSLWVLSPLILFTKELQPAAWQTNMRMYHTRAKPFYADAFGKNIESWKRSVRKATGEEADILFTAQEKDDTTSSSALSSARKGAVKRSHTLAKTLRNASGGDKNSASDTRGTGSHMYSEVFANAIDEMAPLVSYEQNFVVDFFHATSLETADFVDNVSAHPPDQRYGTNLAERKPTEPDREMARRVATTMEEIFGFFTTELSKLMDWTVVSDPIQGVGAMACLSRHSYFLQDGSQEFLLQMIDGLMARMQNRFTKFVDEQIRAIEDTKVKIKKRKGVIAFMKIFPHFSSAVENVLNAVGGADYERGADSMFEVRRRVDEAYSRINRAMFDSLKVIAKESPAAAPQAQRQPTDDAEDKEMLNYHILIIENMNHYIQEVDDGGKEGVLGEWKGRALMERAEAMENYVSRVIRRPLGKLLEFLDSLDALKSNHPHNPAAITSRPTYSRKTFRHLLQAHDAKELRRGIDALRRRIEKHFGDADDAETSRALVAAVYRECERAYEKTLARVEAVVKELYPPTEGEKSAEIEFGKADIGAGFRR